MGSSNSAPVQRSSASPSPSVPAPMEIVKEVIREVPTEHHYHTHTETIKTRDSRARNYAKALKESLEKSHSKSISGLNVRLDIMSRRIKQLEDRKPEEKQILTVETKHIETIREVSTAMDKRMLLVIALATAVNMALIFLK